jgi:hypothetical protein
VYAVNVDGNKPKNDMFNGKRYSSISYSLIICHALTNWKERNEHVFNNKSSLPSIVMHKIREEGKDWILAGAKSLAELVS